MHWAAWELFDAATFGTYLATAAALVMARTLQGGVRAGSTARGCWPTAPSPGC